MNFKDLKKSLSNGVKPIYLLHGDDAFLLERGVRILIDGSIVDETLNLTRYEGSELKGETDKLISALTSYPFMGDKRVVLVKEYYPLASDIKNLKKYFENPCETTVFIIANSSSSESLLKLPSVTEVNCSKGDEALCSMWIKSEAKKAGVQISEGAVNKIIDYCYADMTKINGEVEKLVAFALKSGKITETDVDALCVKELDYKAYEVVEFIASKKYDSAYNCLSEIFASGSESQKLFVSLYYHFRKLLYVSLSNSLTDREIAIMLKTKEYPIKLARRQAKSFPVKRLKQIVDKLSLYDERFKQGYVEPQSAIWNGIFNILVG